MTDPRHFDFADTRHITATCMCGLTNVPENTYPEDITD